ncbi:MAG: transketolase family protein [Acidimicrobiales bacterium]
MDPFDQQAVAIIRGLAMDAPLAARSGHQGTAMALAPLAHVLFHRVLRHDPTDPSWPDRDRFVLSNGHASILQYAALFLAGYGLELDDLRAFRQWGSRTPGHPEAGHGTPGIEVTTGPLGQGFANAVGMAIAEAHLRARFGAEVMDHRTFVLAGDGCLQEGISHEAASLAGHLGLGRLIVVFDDNGITIDGTTGLSCGDDAVTRFGAYGWHVLELGDVADDLDALEAGLRTAMTVEDRPSLVLLRSHIGAPSPRWTDEHEAHGNPFIAADVTATKAVLGMPDEPFWAPDPLVERYRAEVAARGGAARAAWQARLDTWSGDRAAWAACWSGGALPGWTDRLPTTAAGASVATRNALQSALDAVAGSLPGLVTGAADLTGNVGLKLAGATVLDRDHPGGTRIHFGIREHAMGAAANGMAAHGGVLPFVGTFFVFSDYLRPALRLAALSRHRVVFVFSHDSVGVGEDGPTHQPVEQLMSLRLVPGLQVLRPADANETAAALRAAIEHPGPTALILTRQGVPVITDGAAVGPGAGPVRHPDRAEVLLVGTGSEVAVCAAAADALAADGISAAVWSMPSWERAAASGTALPDLPTVSCEAGVTIGWDRWADVTIGIDRFGASAPGDVVLRELGITPAAVAAAARTLLGR